MRINREIFAQSHLDKLGQLSAPDGKSSTSQTKSESSPRRTLIEPHKITLGNHSAHFTVDKIDSAQGGKNCSTSKNSTSLSDLVKSLPSFSQNDLNKSLASQDYPLASISNGGVKKPFSRYEQNAIAFRQAHCKSEFAFYCHRKLR